MATPVYTIEPNPHWVIIDNFSKLPDGAAIYTYRSLNPSEFKPAFEDAAGTIEYGQPIVGFGNGTMPPIYWKFDPDNPDETYYIRVYDSADPTVQQFLWDFDGLSGGTGGGGGNVTEAFNLENFIINGILFRNIGNQAGTPSLPLSLTLAPGANEGFVNDPSSPDVVADGPVGPDIVFAKTVATSSDQINFIDFTPLGVHQLLADVTPQQYLNYQCTSPGAGETYKYVQFPISQGVQSLSSQPMTVKIWARCNSGNTTLTLFWRQFYGSGGAPSSEQIVPIDTLTLNNTWQRFDRPSIVPDAITQTLGKCGNDGLFLLIGYPLNAQTNIDFIKPSLYFGTESVPDIDFFTNDQIDSIISLPRTGDIRTSLNSFSPYGWVQMQDGTIGTNDSGGSSNATARANIDTFPLFDLIWNAFSATPTSQALAPMFTSAGAPVAYGANSVDDFTAHNQLSLTRNLGRVMAGALPVSASQSFTRNVNDLDVTSSAGFYTGMSVTVSGGGLPTPLIAGNIYYAIIVSQTKIALATTTANALAGTKIVLTSAGTGTIVSVNIEILGSFIGEESHVQSLAELASHTHTIFNGTQNFIVTGGAVTSIGTGVTGAQFQGTTDARGSSVPATIMQPTVYMNVFIKL